MFHRDFFTHFGRRDAHDGAGRGLGRGFGRGFGRGRGHHHHHGGGRLFDHGDLRWVVLGLLAEKPRYGYEIIKELEERVGGEYSPSPGVVYPTLTLLEETGLATVSEQNGNRKLYALTPEGEAAYQENKAQIDAIMARVGGARRGPPATVVRALENMMMAVRLKLRDESLTEEQVRALTDLLDQTARAVEGL